MQPPLPHVNSVACTSTAVLDTVLKLTKFTTCSARVTTSATTGNAALITYAGDAAAAAGVRIQLNGGCSKVVPLPVLVSCCLGYASHICGKCLRLPSLTHDGCPVVVVVLAIIVVSLVGVPRATGQR
jgi:hypothetical protein